MDIQKEKKAIKGLKSLYMEMWDLTEDQKDEFDSLVSRVFSFGKQQAQKVAVPEWISLEDEEPNIGETVLICWSDDFDVEPEKDFMDVDIDSGVHYWSNFENDKPTHWMLIPQPPKTQEQA